MTDPVASTVVHYCCVYIKNKKIHSYNNGDHELESLAELCLENVPPFHSWYLHRTGKRTYGFLIENECTYLVMADSSLSNPEIMQFLERLRNAFVTTIKGGLQQELVSLVPPLIVLCADAAQPTPTEQTPERPLSSNGGALTKVPLLGKTTSKHERKKMKERDIEASENHLDKVQNDMPRETTEEICLQKSSSRGHNLQIAQRLWWHHVKIIVIIDVILCLVLFGIWLRVCNFFNCISSN